MIDNKIHEFSKTADDNRSAAKAQLGQAADKAGEAGDKLGDAAASAAASANATLEEFGIYTDQMAETARRKTYEMQDVLIEEIRNNPIRSVAIAALFGYALAVYRRF